mmetsp:Transcript_40590/g.90235  ORF Transcript_40590/g.90235 Transcript_40590/m.90235 type:complete len:225 (-) Transcript_40590:1560-2234(-)
MKCLIGQSCRSYLGISCLNICTCSFHSRDTASTSTPGLEALAPGSVASATRSTAARESSSAARAPRASARLTSTGVGVNASRVVPRLALPATLLSLDSDASSRPLPSLPGASSAPTSSARPAMASSRGLPLGVLSASATASSLLVPAALGRCSTSAAASSFSATAALLDLPAAASSQIRSNSWPKLAARRSLPALSSPTRLPKPSSTLPPDALYVVARASRVAM